MVEKSKKDHRAGECMRERMIHGRQRTSEPGKKKQKHAAGMPAGLLRPAHRQRQCARWSARRKRDAWVVLCVLLLGVGTIITIVTLSSGRLHMEAQAPGAQPGISSVTGTMASPTEGSPVPPATVIMRTAQARIYPFPSSNIGLMQPAVDAQGNVWVGEMYANHLARLDAQTGVVTTWDPPNGKHGLMTTTVDTQGNVWFVEQAANYLGRFDPVQQTFRTFPLGTVHGRPMGPQDLQFDTSGQLWFTAPVAGRIGRLDPATGRVQTWPVPPPRTGIPSSPFSLTVMPSGQIWFGDLTGGAVGHLDPATGKVTLYHLSDPQATVFSLAHDARGQIWFTEIVPGKLGMVDSATGKVTERPVPAVSGTSAFLYRLVVVPSGEVWFVDNTAHALVRYTPDNAMYTFFQLSASSGGPYGLYGLTRDATGKLWFSASGSSTNAVGEMNP